MGKLIVISLYTRLMCIINTYKLSKGYACRITYWGTKQKEYIFIYTAHEEIRILTVPCLDILGEWRDNSSFILLLYRHCVQVGLFVLDSSLGAVGDPQVCLESLLWYRFRLKSTCSICSDSLYLWFDLHWGPQKIKPIFGTRMGSWSVKSYVHGSVRYCSTAGIGPQINTKKTPR